MLSASPLVSGKTYALQVSCRDSTQQFGQGCEIGNGAWVEVDPDTARVSANDGGATGYYRPEDLHLDPTYGGTGIRFCWANTGNEGASNYGEVICGEDIMPDAAPADMRTVVVNRFVEGDTDFTSADNLAFQPISGILYVIEDHDNGDIFACLPDGDDRDIKSDGCVKILSIVDTSAEPTGFMFSPDGTIAYVVVQHSAGSPSELSWDDYDTDDLLIISGFGDPTNLTPTAFGATVEAALSTDSNDIFGFGTPLTASAVQP
jgi:secreted PhoX family phosphatase